MSEYGFRCTRCGMRATRTTDSRPTGAFCTRRRRICTCGNRFSTYEIDANSFALLESLKAGKLKGALEQALAAMAEAGQ